MTSPRRRKKSNFSDNQISPSLPLTNLDDRGSRRDAAIGAKVQSRNVGAKITDGLANYILKTYAALPATNRRPEKADITNSKIQVSFPAMNKKIVCFDTTRHGCIFFNNRFLDTHHLIELVLC